jgi:hypothetical protein
MKYNLAQINIARMLGPIDSPVMAGFVAQLDEVNAVADQSPGFVWRLQSESGAATDIQAFDDPMILINMSVWESIEALRDYTYKSMHVMVSKDRRKWFEPMDGPHLALWWISENHTPTPEEGKQRLEHLEKYGPTENAFTFLDAHSPVGESLGNVIRESQTC